MKQLVNNLLSTAGITINGNRNYDIQIHNEAFYDRVLAGGSLALGEMYMDGWWDCKAPDIFFTKILSARLDEKVRNNFRLKLAVLKSKFMNLQKPSRAFKIAQHHYDIGNDLYENMLDERLVYTCGFWQNAKTLNEAQEAKLELICRKLQLKPGMHVLDIGCGWGSFAKYAAENYGVYVTGITVSEEQLKLGRQLCRDLPVELLLMDYRSLSGKWDAIVSLGMFEHVGHKNYRTYMQVVKNCLEPGGLFLLHTIGCNKSQTVTDPWIDKYIFPNSLIPSVSQVAVAADGLFVMEDWHNFGADYDKTLMAWHKNFTTNWLNIKHKYGEHFYRMWTYYLLVSAASFRVRKNNLWQIVFSDNGVNGGYNSIRYLAKQGKAIKKLSTAPGRNRAVI